MEQHVAVVGAGPAGATAAYVLARSGCRVTLLDRLPFPRDKPCGDLIGTSAIAALHELGLVTALLAAHEPLRGAFVYAPTGRSIGALVNTRIAARWGARVIARREFDAALVEAAVAAGARFRCGAAVGVERAADGAISGVRLSDGTTLEAPITIGADGWSSVVARAIVTTARRPADAGLAIRSYFSSVATPQAMRFFVGAPGDGYGWIFPTADGGANVGLGFVRDEPGAGDIVAAFGRFLGRPELRGARECGSRRSWPIPFGWRGTPVSTAGALLAGDAASLASALSGSGIFSAIVSGALAGRVAAQALASGERAAAILATYERRLRPLARRLRAERYIHGLAGTPAGSTAAIDIARRLPGAGRLAVGWLLNLG